MRDRLLLALEVAFVLIGLAGVALLFGAAWAMVTAGVVGVAAVEARS